MGGTQLMYLKHVVCPLHYISPHPLLIDMNKLLCGSSLVGNIVVLPELVSRAPRMMEP